jgi:predicted RNA-binding Zn ribbon-like protein
VTKSPQFAVLGRAVYEAAQRAADVLDILLRGDDERPALALALLAYGEPEPIDISLADLAELRRAAADLHKIFTARDVSEAAYRISELLRKCAYPPRLTTHGGEPGWHLHVDSRDDSSWGEWFLTSSCLALAVLLAERQQPPAGICASPSCRRPYVNTNRGIQRRYCSARCGTRERVAAYRKSHHASRQGE